MPAIVSRPPDTTETGTVEIDATTPGLHLPERGPGRPHGHADPSSRPRYRVLHRRLQDRVPEDAADHVAGSRDREHREREPERVDSPNTTIAAPHTTIASMIARPCRRTCLARPENAVARNARARAPRRAVRGPALRPVPSSSATAGNSAIGNPKIIAFRSARNTDWIVRLPFRNRNPSTIAAQLTDAASSAGGDGSMRPRSRSRTGT